MSRTQASSPGPLVLKQGIYDINVAPQYPIGERLVLNDGRVFHYARDGGSGLSAGKVNLMATNISTHHAVAVTAATAGATQLTVTLGVTNAVTENQYAGGFIGIISGTGLGQIYRILSHPAAAASATCVLTLEDELKVTLASAYGDLMPNRWGAVIESADEEHVAAGVPVVAVTASYYFWDQTWGPCVALSGDTAAQGTELELGDTAGEVLTHGAATEGGIVGLSWGQARASGEYNFAFLTICP